MKKQVIRLTESDLHNIIKESVKQIMNEKYYSDADYDFNDNDDIFDMKSKSDEELENIINGNDNIGNAKYYENDFDDGEDIANDHMEQAQDEYAVRNKDYAFKHGKMPKANYDYTMDDYQNDNLPGDQENFNVKDNDFYRNMYTGNNF